MVPSAIELGILVSDAFMKGQSEGTYGGGTSDQSTNNLLLVARLVARTLSEILGVDPRVS